MTSHVGRLAAGTGLAVAALSGWMGPARADQAAQIAAARAAVKHVIVIMQENRSFDSYFGTFPGAAGFPVDAGGKITICVPIDPKRPALGCVTPFHDTHTLNAGGPHDNPDYIADVAGGAMNGFIFSQYKGRKHCKNPNAPSCAGLDAGVDRHDTVGYHTDAELPNYWAYARTFMLQDHLFESVASASLPSHLYLLSEWSARCGNAADPTSCVSKTRMTRPPKTPPNSGYAWTDLTYLLDTAAVPWKYYLAEGAEPDCEKGEMTCAPKLQKTTVPGIWNPLPGFTTFAAKAAADTSYWGTHIVPVNQFLADVETHQLPSVSWLAPQAVSEHPPGDIVDGMNYVTTIVNTVMDSPYWQDSVIFIAWDDWGGFYDHMVPPVADTHRGAGLRAARAWPGHRVLRACRDDRSPDAQSPSRIGSSTCQPA